MTYLGFVIHNFSFLNICLILVEIAQMGTYAWLLLVISDVTKNPSQVEALFPSIAIILALQLTLPQIKVVLSCVINQRCHEKIAQIGKYFIPNERLNASSAGRLLSLTADHGTILASLISLPLGAILFAAIINNKELYLFEILLCGGVASAISVILGYLKKQNAIILVDEQHVRAKAFDAAISQSKDRMLPFTIFQKELRIRFHESLVDESLSHLPFGMVLLLSLALLSQSYITFAELILIVPSTIFFVQLLTDMFHRYAMLARLDTSYSRLLTACQNA